MEITALKPEHYHEVCDIYLQGIRTGNATFQTEIPTWEQWDKAHLKTCRIVMTNDKSVLGWAALTPFSGRRVYAGVAEVSVYVSDSERGKGIGKKLLQELIKQSEAHGLWTLQSAIFPENSASIKLHEACGFRIVGYREKIGNQNGIWRDNLFLERRSKTVGI